MSAFPALDQANREKGNFPPKRSPRWVIDRALTENSVKKKARLYTMWLGIAAGLTFSLALWGYEVILFIGAHVAYPWLSLLAGSILCVAVGMSAALLTQLAKKAIWGIVFWVVAAAAMAQIAITVPLKIVPSLMKFLEPALQARLPLYPITDAFRTWSGIGTIWLAIFFGILGLLQLTLVEQGVSGATTAGRMAPYFVFIPVMALASVVSSNLISEQLRAPLIVTGHLFQFAIENQNVDVDPALAREMHLSSVKPIADLLNRPRRLFLGKYDESYWQVEVLIDFNGEWAHCTVVNEQTSFCERLSSP